MRSEGQVRRVRLSSNLQVSGLGVAALLLTFWCGSVGSAAVASLSTSREQAELERREARIAVAESRIEKYREGLDERTAELAQRQQFIEQMVEAHIGDIPEGEEAPVGMIDKADKTGAALPEADRLARIEAEQFAFVDRLTRYAERRSATASEAIRKLGLNPKAISAGTAQGEGGPLERLSTGKDGSLDPRFQRLGMSLARMDALERGLASIPQVKPAQVAYVSSSYGYRSDPFTRSAAFHAGLDFPGPMGSPIFAAAKGKVTFVGWRQGYGNYIEISHGNGLTTRYGHLSAFKTKVGQQVDAGTVIAAMGSTGRSTGPHLHFEVRVNGQPVNPRPFLEPATNVQREEAH